MQTMKVNSVKSGIFAAFAFAFACALAFTNAYAQKTPGYNTRIPDVIMTPDKVETPIGTLEYFDGLPSEATAERCTTTSIGREAWRPS